MHQHHCRKFPEHGRTLAMLQLGSSCKLQALALLPLDDIRRQAMTLVDWPICKLAHTFARAQNRSKLSAIMPTAVSVQAAMQPLTAHRQHCKAPHALMPRGVQQQPSTCGGGSAVSGMQADTSHQHGAPNFTLRGLRRSPIGSAPA